MCIRDSLILNDDKYVLESSTHHSEHSNAQYDMGISNQSLLTQMFSLQIQLCCGLSGVCVYKTVSLLPHRQVGMLLYQYALRGLKHLISQLKCHRILHPVSLEILYVLHNERHSSPLR